MRPAAPFCTHWRMYSFICASEKRTPGRSAGAELVSACGRNRRRRKAHQPAPSGRGPCTRRPCRCCPWSGRRRVPERCLRVDPSSSATQRHTRETTISFSFTMFLCARDVRIFISRMAVIGKPSFSLSCQGDAVSATPSLSRRGRAMRIFFSATTSPVERLRPLNTCGSVSEAPPRLLASAPAHTSPLQSARTSRGRTRPQSARCPTTAAPAARTPWRSADRGRLKPHLCKRERWVETRQDTGSN